jgi:hypothetical protein
MGVKISFMYVVLLEKKMLQINVFLFGKVAVICPVSSTTCYYNNIQNTGCGIRLVICHS